MTALKALGISRISRRGQADRCSILYHADMPRCAPGEKLSTHGTGHHDPSPKNFRSLHRQHIDMGWKFYAILLGVIPISGVLLIVLILPLLPEGITSTRGVWVALLPLAFLPIKFFGAYFYCKKRVVSIRRRVMYSLASCVLSLLIVGGYLGLVFTVLCATGVCG